MRYGHSVVVFMRRSFRDHPCFMVLFRAFGSTMHTQPSCSNACNASGSFVSYTPCSHPSPTELESEQRIIEHLTHMHAYTHIWLSWLARCGEVCHQEHTSTSGSARCAANIRPASLNCFSSITTCTSQVPTICSVWLSLSRCAFQRPLNLISCSSHWNQCFTDVIGIVIYSSPASKTQSLPFRSKDTIMGQRSISQPWLIKTQSVSAFWVQEQDYNHTVQQTSIRLKDWRPWGSTRLTLAPGYSSVLGARVLR